MLNFNLLDFYKNLMHIQNMKYTKEMHEEDTRLSHFFFKKFYGRCKYNQTVKDDIIQISIVAMWRARMAYDPSRAKWSTFASWACRTAVSRFLYRTIRYNEGQHVSLDMEIYDNGNLLDVFGISDECGEDLLYLRTVIAKVASSMSNKNTSEIIDLCMQGFTRKEMELGLFIIWSFRSESNRRPAHYK